MNEKITNYIDKITSICGSKNVLDSLEVNWHCGWLSAQFYDVKGDYQIHVDSALIVDEGVVWIKTCCTDLQCSYALAEDIVRDFGSDNDAKENNNFYTKDTLHGVCIMGIKEVAIKDNLYFDLDSYVNAMIDSTLMLASEIGEQWSPMYDMDSYDKYLYEED